MKKLIALLFIVLGFTTTSVFADFNAPTNYYEHTFTTAEEVHIISNGQDFFYDKLSNADVYYNDELVVENGSVVDPTLWDWVEYPDENHFVLFDDLFNAVVVIFYDLGNYVDLSAGIDVEYAAGAMYKPIAGTYTIGVEVLADSPIRPQIAIDSVLDNTFDLQVTNYNSYEVTFVGDIYDSTGTLLNANAIVYDMQPDSTEIIDVDYLDWVDKIPFNEETEYLIDGYFIKTFSAAGFSPSDKSDRVSAYTGLIQTYNVNITYNATFGDVTGPSSSLPREMLTFQANPNSAYNFSGWNVTAGEKTTFIDASKNPLYYEMPYSDITVEAIFTQRTFEAGYKTFLFTINESGKRYTSNDPDFFTEGRVENAIIYIDGVKVVEKGKIIDDTVWLNYYDNPYMENAVELQDIFDTDSGLLTIHYGDGTNFQTNTQQGDVWLWISGGDLTAPFELEILLPETDPNPKIIIDDTEENVPDNIDAALGLINANNVYGYVTLFVITVFIVNIVLMYIGMTPIIYIVINLLIGVLFTSMGMLPLFVNIIWYGFIGVGFIATIKGGAVSE